MSSSLVKRALLTLLRPLQFLGYALVGFVPRRMDQWAFGCWSGHRFGDNAGAVFSYLAEHPEHGLRTAWITNERSIRHQLRAEGHRCYTAWSPGGMWFAARAGVFVYDSLPKDINFWLSRGARLVHLRHGIGIKKIERAIDAPGHRLYKLFHGTPLQRLVWRTLLPWHVPTPDLLMSCSPIHASQGEWLYGVPPDRIRITGFARHDRLLASPIQDRSAIPTFGRKVPDDRPVFIYLPTFREGLGRQAFDWDVLDAAAADAGITIAVKLHFVDADRGVLGTDQVTRSEHLRMVDPMIDPSETYPHADGMITDFSSAPFDFMLLERPIVYYVPDAEDFTRARPLMYRLEEIAVGPICVDGPALTAALTAARDQGLGAHRERYEQLRDLFHTYPPGDASARVVDAVLETLVHGKEDPSLPYRHQHRPDRPREEMLAIPAPPGAPDPGADRSGADPRPAPAGRGIEPGEVLEIPDHPPLVIESVIQRNWSRVGIASNDDGRFFVKQFIDRIGRSHERGYDGDEAALAAVGDRIGDVRVVPVVGRIPERLITVSPFVEMSTLESISRRHRKGAADARRVGQAMADILLACRLEDDPDTVRTWKGMDPKNIGWSDDGTLWLFDFGPLVDIPLHVAAARVMAAGLLSRWVARPGLHLVAPEPWLLRSVCAPLAPLTDLHEVEKVLRQHHDLRQREPQRQGARAFATRIGLNTLGRVHWAVLNREARRLLADRSSGVRQS
ncbi:MAG: CDP-glycerol glycerophosphotransferase family protein [Acidimicrobiales bacterium]